MRKYFIFVCLFLVLALDANTFGQQKVSYKSNFLEETVRVDILVNEKMPQITPEYRENLRKQVNTQYLPMFKTYSLEDVFVSALVSKLVDSKQLLKKSPLVGDFPLQFVDSEEVSQFAEEAMKSGAFTLSKAQILNAMSDAASHNGTVYFKTSFVKKTSFEDIVAIMAHELSHSQDEQIKKIIALQLKKDNVITDTEYQHYKIRLEVMCDLQALKILQSLQQYGVSPKWLVEASKKWMFEGVEKNIRVELAQYHQKLIANDTVAAK